MSKVFRIYSGGQEGSHWFDSIAMSSTQIEAISDRERSGGRFPTSIPSPFARIDLVNNAFNKIGRGTSPSVNGDSDAHLLVSDAFDVAQLFFEYPFFRREISIERIKLDDVKDNLHQSNSPLHRQFAKTMDLYLTGEHDKDYFQFSGVPDLFVVRYRGQIIGGTNGLTWFFASSRADKFREEGLSGITFGQKIPLDGNPRSLIERDDTFIRYVFFLRNTIKSSSGVEAYLARCLRELHEAGRSDFANELASLRTEPVGLEPLFTKGSTGATVSLHGRQLYCRGKVTEVQSDLRLAKSNDLEGQGDRPIVIPWGDEYNHVPERGAFRYGPDFWNPDWKESQQRYNPRLYEGESVLPHVHINEKWIGIDNVLDGTLYKMNHSLDPNRVYTLGPRGEYLFPIKKEFLDYFSVEEVSKMLSLAELAGDWVEVTVKIPVQNGRFIQFVKRYSKSPLVGASGSVGAIVECAASLALNTLFKGFESRNQANYLLYMATKEAQLRVGLLTRAKDNRLTSVDAKTENRSEGQGVQTYVTRFDVAPDVISMSSEGESAGLILPKLKQYRPSAESFHFAVDLGTTSTHIEYTSDRDFGGRPRALSISNTPGLLKTFREPSDGEAAVAIRELEGYIHHAGLPETLNTEQFEGKGVEYPLPMRTCLLENRTINYQQFGNAFAFLKSNIGFDYQRQEIKNHLSAKTNLKWDSHSTVGQNQLEQFVEQILFLCWMKVVESEANLSAVRITWFYPSSMPANQRGSFGNIWKERYERVFGRAAANSIERMPESLAPLFYYQRESAHSIATGVISCSIDIGGGTSDLVFADGQTPMFTTSCRFAGNAVFGDGYSQGGYGRNGFVNKFSKPLAESLEKNELTVLLNSHDQTEKGQSSVEMINFLFGLEHSAAIRQRQLTNISLSKSINLSGSMKLPLLVFIAALLHHTARACRAAPVGLPHRLFFSGNGAQMINILSADSEKRDIAEFAKHVWQMTSDNCPPRVTVEILNRPKEATAKGGLYKMDGIEACAEKLILEGEMSLADQIPSVDRILAEDDLLIPELDSVFELLDGLKEINKEFSFDDNFGIPKDAMNQYSDLVEERKQDGSFRNWMRQGLEELQHLAGSQALLTESPFFFALRGFLPDLSSHL